MCQSDACDVGGIYTKHARIVFAIAQNMGHIWINFQCQPTLEIS